MLRISEYIERAIRGEELRKFEGVILIWNLTNECNLRCKHCYSGATSLRREELSYEEISSIVPSLADEGVRFAILSGGEPLLREDIFKVAELLKSAGIRTYLSTNGTLIGKENLPLIKESFDYVGISLDGSAQTHDSFRGEPGSFERSLRAIEMCLSWGIDVGIRFTLTDMTFGDLPYVFRLAQDLGVHKLYVSHLVYSGRGARLSSPEKELYRKLVEFMVDKALELYESGRRLRVVSGNNEADAVILLKRFGRVYPEYEDRLYQILKGWGGNQAGVRLVNINHRGEVRPDPFFFHSLGNLRERSFGDIWNSNGILSKLREYPRRIKGRCSGCEFLEICNGNSRARAFFSSGDYFGEDPACYIC
jgi:radical SAM protein with 4Fe4S-binding SPASM domain